MNNELDWFEAAWERSHSGDAPVVVSWKAEPESDVILQVTAFPTLEPGKTTYDWEGYEENGSCASLAEAQKYAEIDYFASDSTRKLDKFTANPFVLNFLGSESTIQFVASPNEILIKGYNTTKAVYLPRTKATQLVRWLSEWLEITTDEDA